MEAPESRYLGHVTPKEGTGFEIAKSIFKTFKMNGAVNSLKVVGGMGHTQTQDAKKVQ